MAALNFKAFRAAVPRSGERLQSRNFAKFARNIKITSGNIVPLRGMLPSGKTELTGTKTLARYRVVGEQAVSDNWLVFDSDVDVVPSPLKDNAKGLVYWTSEDFDPRMSIFEKVVSGPGPYPADWYALGIPNPIVTPTIASVSGGSGSTVSRYYTYTYVTPLGEESGPSAASAIVSGYGNGTWNITMNGVAPPNTGVVSVAALLPTGYVRFTLDTIFGIQKGTRIRVAGITQVSADPAETLMNGDHTVTAVDATNKTVDVYLPNQVAPSSVAGASWERVAKFNTVGMTKRIYRAAGTEAVPKFVAEVPVAQMTYADTIADTALGSLCEALSNLPAPATLHAAISLPNGCLVGIADNELCFSDPYKPYAWPDNNRYSFSGRGVALAAAGNSVILMTDSYPVLYIGSDPAAMSPSTMETYAPCVSKRGVVRVGGGAIYPSNDGLWLVSPASVNLLTRALYRLDEWSALNPTSFDAEYHDGQYFATHTPAGETERKILVLDIGELDSAVTVDDYADALLRNDYDGHMYVVKDGDIRKWDADDARRYVTEWTSVEVQLDQPRNFSHAQVHGDFSQVVPQDTSVLDSNTALMEAGPDAVNGHLNGDQFAELELNGSYLQEYYPPTPRTVQFVLFDGDTPIYSRQVTSSRPFRLPSGLKYETVRVGVNTSVPVYSVTIAESTEELAEASV
jgi:hypothetical protein